MSAPNLGDARAPNDDNTYTGDISSSVFSLDYFRQKAGEFQASLNAADQAYQAGLAAYEIAQTEQLGALLSDYEARGATLKATAEAVNMGAGIINSAGGRMPVLSIPQTLGIPPLVLPAAAIAAVAAISGIVAWSMGYTRAMNDAISAARDIVTDPEQRAALETQLTRARDANTFNFSTGISSIANIVKWVAIGGLAFLAWRELRPRLSSDD